MKKKKIRFVSLAIYIATLVSLSRAEIVHALHLSEASALIIEVILIVGLFAIGEYDIDTTKKEFLNQIKNNEKVFLQQIENLKKCTLFVESFERYCKECKDAISDSKNESVILTIQTPLTVDPDSSPDRGYFNEYIAETAYQLLLKSSDTSTSKITTYKRLIVINDSNDDNEINSEKLKLEMFVKNIYSRLEEMSDATWAPNLKNIHIGIVDAKHIRSSPFSNLDILVILNTHLVIAFPIDEEKTNSYTWSTGIHMNGSYNQVEKFNSGIKEFEKIYKRVWENPQTKKIDFGNYHDKSNLGFSEKKIIEAIDLTFSQILNG
jgi:hypothetical protein